MNDSVEAPLYAVGKRADAAAPALSIVIPMFNEEGNAAILIEEVAAALSPETLSPDTQPEGGAFEIVVVDDASRDGTVAVLRAVRERVPQLRILSHAANAGQSRSIRTGVLAARAPVIATLDGDGQNDPADLPALRAALLRAGAPPLLAMVAGERQKRKDSQAKLVASRLANGIRKKLLNDAANDTGCGLKVFYRDAFLHLPYFDHLHRYLPALMRREGFAVEFVPVSHRERLSGMSKYTNWQRAVVAVRDVMGVIWLNARARQPDKITEL